ncbi:MAG: peptidyl-prolyl cis-trans isomerase [Thermoanaerobaculia bacterium]
MRMRNRWMAVGLLLAACGHPVPEGAVALYEGGEVTRQELDARIVSLPEDSRRPEDGDFAAWYERLTREVAVDELLLAEAERSDLQADEGFVRAWESVRRRIAAAAYLKAHGGEETLSPEDVRGYFEQHRNEYRQEARRDVQHLYLRRRAGEDDTALRERMEALRERIRSGESFDDVARGYSDSESRHRGGSIGWVVPAQLAPEAAAIVFAQDEGELGETVVTSDGAHVFLVRQAVEARDYAFEDVQKAARVRAGQAKAAATIERLASALDPPPGSVVPSDEELRVLLGQGDDEALVLRVGEASWTVGELRRSLRTVPPEAREDPAQLVRSLERQELLARAAEDEGLLEAPATRQQLEAARRALLLEAYRRRWLVERTEEDEAALREHYRANQRRFSTPLRLRLRVLEVPAGTDPASTMAELEAAVPRLDAGGATLDELADALGGDVRETGWVDLTALQENGGKVAMMLAGLDAGGHSSPYRRGDDLEIVEVVERAEPAPRPFEQVREEVANHRVESSGSELYARETEALLESVRFRILPDRIEALDGAASHASP